MEGEEWRAFKHDTEAGRLLARLYGVEGSGNKPKISYPKLKSSSTKKQLQHDSQWRAVGAPNTRDPTEKRYDRTKAAAVPVPKFGRNKPNRTAAVDIIPKRKPAVSCKIELDHRKQRSEAYRPPKQNVIYSEEEKNKLNEINTYRGGKGLPTDLTHPVGPMPSEMQRQEKEADRVRLAREKRRFRMNGCNTRNESDKTDVPIAEKPKGSKEVLFEQILDEIKDRRSWQLQMEACGEGGHSRRTVSFEISARVQELYRLDKQRAKKVLHDLNTSMDLTF